MKELVIDDVTAGLTIGELLRQAEDGEIVLRNVAGQSIGWLSPAPEPLPPLTPEELEEIRPRSRSDPSNDLTTTELLAHLHALTADE